MDKVFSTNRKGKPLPAPAVLTPEQTIQVAGGINPQPLPPEQGRPSAKLD